ncbi:MAG: L-aspartate oxidase, partial [Gemmatimonadetes bacterium]|nr:L-aspartate oxidase [Gemmatimonadota bacterium]
GEVACTGVHGANRLASNSLLEAVVYSHRAALAVRDDLAGEPTDGCAPAPSSGEAPDEPDGREEPAEIRTELRGVLWDDCGIVRGDHGLEDAEARVEALHRRAEALWRRSPVTADAAETRNLCQVGALIVASARMRRESRGLHFNVDHPFTDERFRADTVLVSGCLSD